MPTASELQPAFSDYSSAKRLDKPEVPGAIMALCRSSL
jgi:hypothetical protein